MSSARAIRIVVAVGLGAGCGRRASAPAGCPPLEVKVDGKPLAVPTVGLAYAGRDDALAVAVFNHEGVTCDELYEQQRSGFRDVPAGELMVGAWAGAAEPAATGVTFSSTTDPPAHRSRAGAKLVTVESAVRDAGGRVALCIPAVVQIPLGGGDTGALPAHPAAEIRGLLVGRYCPRPP